MEFNKLSQEAQKRVLCEVYSQMYEMGTPVTEREAISIAKSYLYTETGEPKEKKLPSQLG